MSFKCECECHKICHTCGNPFRGPYDYHINCADTIGPSANQILSLKDPSTPWEDK